MKDYKKIIENKRLEAGKLMTEDQIFKCNVAIHTASVASGISGAIPIPIADALPISAAQISMVIALGNTFNQEISDIAARSLIGTAASTFVGRNLAKLIPGIGWVVSAAVASGVTEAIGWTIAVDMAKNFRKEWKYLKLASKKAKAEMDERYSQHSHNKRITNVEAEDFSEDIDNADIPHD